MTWGPEGGTGYLYDAAGNRVAKGTINAWTCDMTANGFTMTEWYVIGPSGEQLTETDGSGNWKHTNVSAGGQLVATYDADPSSGTQALHFQFADWLGSRRVQTDYEGSVEETCQSLPFGDGLNCAQTSIATADDATEHHFTQKERDTESGNDYMFARYYNSATGRFLSPDWSAKEEPVPYAKLENPQSLNLYGFVYNDPLSHADPDGHAGCSIEGMASCKHLIADAAVQDEGQGLSIGGTSVKKAKDTTPARFIKKGKPKPHGSWMEYTYQLANADGKPLTGTTIYDPTGSNNTATEYKTLVNRTSADTGPTTVTSAMPYGEVSDKVGWEAPSLPKADVDQIVNIAFTVNYQGKIYPITTQMQHENKYSDGKYTNTVTVVVP